MEEDARGAPFFTSKSDGSLVRHAEEFNSQRNGLPGAISAENSPREKQKEKRKKKKGKKKKKKRPGESESPVREKSKQKKKSRRSSSAEERKRRDSARPVVRAISPPCNAQACDSSGEKAKNVPGYMRKFNKNYGTESGQKLIENAGRRALKAPATSIVDEEGKKRGLLAVAGSRRYFLVMDRVGDTHVGSAHGARGLVFKGWDSALKRFVAIKFQTLPRLCLPPSFDSEGETQQALLIKKQIASTVNMMLPFREVAVMKFIRDCQPRMYDADNVHTHVMREGSLAILPLFDSFYNPLSDVHHIVTPYSDIGDLVRIFDIKERICLRERREYAEIVQSLFGDMVSALHYLHSIGVCHGDVKLDNFILFWDARRGRFCVRLADFGLSYFSSPGKLTHSTSLTPLYSSPELIDAALAEAVYIDSVDRYKRNSVGRYVVSTPFAATDSGPRCRVAARMLDVPKIVYPAGTSDVWALGVCLYCFVFESQPFAPDKIEETDDSTVEFARAIRLEQSRFFSRTDFAHIRCEEMESELEPLRLIDSIFKEAWPMRPSALELVQYSPWVRAAVVGDCKASSSSSLAKSLPNACSRERLASKSFSSDSLSASPPVSTLSPFAELMRQGCGTEIALQY